MSAEVHITFAVAAANWSCQPWFYIYNLQAATGVPPSCILPSPIACIQMWLNTTTFHVKIGTFEGVCEHLWPSWINNAEQRTTLVLLRCAVMSHDITQPCVLATFIFNAETVYVLLHLYWGVSNHSLSRFFTVFYGRLWFSERSVAILIAVN